MIVLYRTALTELTLIGMSLGVMLFPAVHHFVSSLVDIMSWCVLCISVALVS
jgi:hypothetical protein